MNQRTRIFLPRWLALLLTISLSFPNPAFPAAPEAPSQYVRSKEGKDHLRQTEPTDDRNSPIAVGLEERLRQAGLEEPNQGSFRKGLMHGALGAAVITAGLVGAYEAGQRGVVPPAVNQPPAKVGQLQPGSAPVKPAQAEPAPMPKEAPRKPAPTAEKPAVSSEAGLKAEVTNFEETEITLKITGAPKGSVAVPFVRVADGPESYIEPNADERALHKIAADGTVTVTTAIRNNTGQFVPGKVDIVIFKSRDDGEEFLKTYRDFQRSVTKGSIKPKPAAIIKIDKEKKIKISSRPQMVPSVLGTEPALVFMPFQSASGLEERGSYRFGLLAGAVAGTALVLAPYSAYKYWSKRDAAPIAPAVAQEAPVEPAPEKPVTPAEQVPVKPATPIEQPPVKLAPINSKNLLEPMKQWVKADPNRVFVQAMWGKAQETAKILDYPDFFEVLVDGGANAVFLSSGYEFLKLSEEQQKEIFQRAAKAGIKIIGFMDGDLPWLDDSKKIQFAKDRVYEPLFERIKDLKPHELGLSILLAADVEMHTREGWRGTLEEYKQYVEVIAGIKQLVDVFNEGYRQQYGVQIVHPLGLLRFEHERYTSEKMLAAARSLVSQDVTGTTIAGMTYHTHEAILRRESSKFYERSQKEGSSSMFGVEFQLPGIVGGPDLTFYGKEKQAPAITLNVWKAVPGSRAIFYHYSNAKQAYEVTRTLIGKEAGLEERSWKIIGPWKLSQLQQNMTEVAYGLAQNGLVALTVRVPMEKGDPPSISVVIEHGPHGYGRWFHSGAIYLEKRAGTFPPEQWYDSFQQILDNFGIVSSQGENLPSEWLITARSYQREDHRSYVRLMLSPIEPNHLAQSVPVPNDMDSPEIYIRRVIVTYMLLAQREKADTLRISLVQGPNREKRSVDLVPAMPLTEESEEDIAEFLRHFGDLSEGQAQNWVWPRGLSTRLQSVAVSHPEVEKKTKQIREVTITLQGGLEERVSVGSRRKFLGAASAGTVSLMTLPAVEAIANMVQPAQAVPAKPLRDELGGNGIIGMIVGGNPADILALNNTRRVNLFSLAVKAGWDTVWISGFVFRRLSFGQQQSILMLADSAGLKTLGFTDGAWDWPQNPRFVANHYRALTEQLAQHNIRSLKLSFLMDIEPYDIPPEGLRAGGRWNGDVKPSRDLVQNVIQPIIDRFGTQMAAKHKRDVVDPAASASILEPFWYKDGERPDPSPAIMPGAVVTNAGIHVPNTQRFVMSYRRTGDQMAKISENLTERANEDRFSFGFGVELGRKPGIENVSLAGDEDQAISVAVEAAKAIKEKDKGKRLQAVFFHADSPLDAARFFGTLLGDLQKPAGKPVPRVQPAKEFTVKVTRPSNFQIPMEFSLDEGLVNKDLVLISVVKTDIWYPQREIPVTAKGAKGSVTATTLRNSPFWGGGTVNRAGLLIERADAKQFLGKRAHGFGQLKLGDDGVLKIILFDNKGKPEVVEKLSAGLEEQVRDFLSGLEEAAPHGMSAIVFGKDFLRKHPAFRAVFAGLEEKKVFLVGENEQVADAVTHLIEKRIPKAVFVGLEEERVEFLRQADLAHIEAFAPIGGELRQLLLATVAQAAGLEEAVVEVWQSFNQLMAGLEDVDSQA